MRVALFALAFLAVPLAAAEPKAHLNLPYAEPKNERQTLDVYASEGGTGRPIVLYVHGGSWIKGDKGSVYKKPQQFADKGYVFASTNYRFHPNVTVKEMAGDIARVIRYLHDHAKEYGGDPDSIVVMGHSAGAHLAALVCTDDRYLAAEKLPLSVVRACVPVDVAMYDIPKRVKDGGPLGNTVGVFGKDEAGQREVSPAAHVARGKSIPPFLILHIADSEERKEQSEWFAKALTAAGVEAKAVSCPDKTHGTINSALGSPTDEPTKAMWAFLEGATKPKK